ncbi:MAG: hypothetical protein LBV60_25170, partial [Streptomyces sp.]|nr:hypothetical protein [Streptomyces sp.]
MRRVRPGAALSRGGGTAGAARDGGATRALTSVAAGETYQDSGDAAGEAYEQPGDAPRLWHVTLSVSGDKSPLNEVRRALEQL